MPERLLLTAAETAETLNLGLTTTWALIRSGELRSIRIGNAVRVPVDAVHAWIERKASAQDHQCHVALGKPPARASSSVPGAAINGVAMTTSTDSISQLEPPLLLRMTEVARLLSVSRSKAYELAARGELPGVVRHNGSLRVHRSTLEQWLLSLVEGNAAPAQITERERGQVMA